LSLLHLLRLRVPRVEFDGSLDGFRDGGRGGQVGAIGLEAVLVSGVLHGVDDAVGARVRVLALDGLCLLLRITRVLQVCDAEMPFSVS